MTSSWDICFNYGISSLGVMNLTGLPLCTSGAASTKFVGYWFGYMIAFFFSYP